MPDAPLDPAAIIAAARRGVAAPAPAPAPPADAWENRARVLLWRNGDLLAQAEAIADDPLAAVRAAAATTAAATTAATTTALSAETPPTPETYLEIELVDHIDPLSPDGLSALLYSVQSGRHGLILRHDGRVVSGWPSDYRRSAPPSYAAWVKRLLQEARPPGYRLPADIDVQRFTTTHVVGPAIAPSDIAPSDTAPAANPPDSIALLSGGVRTVTLDHLTRQALIDAAARAAAWLLRHQRPDGRFAYEFLPALHGWSQHDSSVRQCGCAWALATAAQLTGEPRFRQAATRAVAGIARGSVRRGGPGGLAYVQTPAEGRRLGAIPLLLLALQELGPGTQVARTLADELTATLLALQQSGGAFGLQSRGLEFSGAEIYYAGQCTLSLARRYAATRRDRLGEAVRSALAHYRRRWDQGWPDAPSQRLAFLAWMLQACDAWDAASPDPDADAIDFAYALADWALPLQFGPDHPNPTWIGGFAGGPGIGTAAYTEGINAALAIAKRRADPARADRYRRSVLLAHRFLLQLVVEPPDLYHYPGDAHLGGVRRNLVGDTLRCDNAQHFLMAALRTARLLQDDEFRL